MDNQKEKISVVIPALNEEKTIEGVLKVALVPNVYEVVVVDDGSTDKTFDLMKELSKKDVRVRIVRHEANEGVGASRRDGIYSSRGEIIVFLDADIKNPPPDIIEKLSLPIIKKDADFVLAAFDNVGRVTELTVRPLLSILFPELSYFSQPISGQFASRRGFLFPDRIESEKAMSGVLIDAYLAGARISEVNVGTINHGKRNMDVKKAQAVANSKACLKRYFEKNKPFNLKDEVIMYGETD